MDYAGDRSSEGPGYPGRETLYQAATAYADDIAVADHLVRTYGHASGDDTATPGQVINWVLRLDPDVMADKTNALKRLAGEYSDVADGGAVDLMRNNWEGYGAQAFEVRWRGLKEYLVGSGASDDGVIHYLGVQVEEMFTLAANANGFQEKCVQAIEIHLAGLRQQYIDALTATGGGGDTAIIEEASKYGGVGAGFGAIGGPTGQAVGGALGVLLGGILGFMEATEKHARDYLKIASAGESFTMSMTELSRGLDVMDRGRYAKGHADDPDSYGENAYRYRDEERGRPQDDPRIDEAWD